jgi:hypothetical protein
MLRAVLLTLVAFPALGLSIQEHTDGFTGVSYVVASDLKVCPPKGITSCATVRMAWTKEDPETVLFRIEVHDTLSVLSLSAKTPDGIRTFNADTGTNLQATRVPAGFAWSSTNSFAIPLSVIESIASSRELGTIRVAGVHSAIDFDFYRKASMRGLPVDGVRSFLERIKKQ